MATQTRNPLEVLHQERRDGRDRTFREPIYRYKRRQLDLADPARDRDRREEI